MNVQLYRGRAGRETCYHTN